MTRRVDILVRCAWLHSTFNKQNKTSLEEMAFIDSLAHKEIERERERVLDFVFVLGMIQRLNVSECLVEYRNGRRITFQCNTVNI